MREEILNKIQELSWKSEVKTILMIDWLKWLLEKLPEEKKEEVKKEVKVELPVEEKKETPKKKIIFKKK